MHQQLPQLKALVKHFTSLDTSSGLQMYLLVNTKKPAKIVTTFDTCPVTDVVTGELIYLLGTASQLKLETRGLGVRYISSPSG